MPGIELPQGRYLSCAFRVATDAGGQTRALLMRNRILARAGMRPQVLTLGAAPDYDRRRELLRERDLLPETVELLNIYEHFRERDWGDTPAGAAPLADLSAHRVAEELGADGAPWRVTYRPPGAHRALYDYLRSDGSPYLRIPAFGLASGSRGRGAIQQVGRDGRVVGEFPTAAHWFRRWIRELAAGQDRTFVFMDSRYVVPHLVPLRARRIYLVYLMHNVHVGAPFRWDSPVNTAYSRVLERIDGMDAMVTLTERQRDDIAQRRGRTTNMHVVPNPVDAPEPPAPEPVRDPHRVTIVARLEPQKRLADAIAAFATVVEAVPAARLDIYGEGSRRDALQAEIDLHGLAGHVTLRGFHPDARETLWTSSAFLMTSAYEGYPLSTLESMSRGCPVVSYDIKYGPREQITDGVDGFLVAPGDVARLADRIVELLRSPALVAEMGAAARETARRLGPEGFLERWAEVLQAAVADEPRRTRIDAIELETTRLRVSRRRRLGFAGVLRVTARSRRARLDSARVELDAIDEDSGDVVAVPLKVECEEDELRLRTAGGPLGGPALPDGARLRLRLTWRNSAWQTELTPPGASGTPPRTAASGRAPV